MATAAPLSRDPTAGERIGRYKLVGFLAAGGFASVWLVRAAESRVSVRPFAMKVIHAQLASQPEFVEMFLDEARIASLVHHANVCSVIDAGVDEGRYFLVMEYILGEPLSKVMKHLSALPIETRVAMAARVIADAAAGLHAAHECCDPAGQHLGIVHRDVAPSNLFVRYDGVTQVLDFGIAKASNRVHRTATGVLKGHVGYMAPEQARGGEIDRRADVWSLGVVLWELLTLKPLFRRSNDFETLLAVTESPIPHASTEVTGIPRELADIVAAALMRDPLERTRTADDMRAALERWLHARSTPAGADAIAAWLAQLFPGGLEAHYSRTRHALQQQVSERSESGAGAFGGAHSSTRASQDPRTHGRRVRRAAIAMGGLVIGLLAPVPTRRPDAFRQPASSVSPTGEQAEPSEATRESGSSPLSMTSPEQATAQGISQREMVLASASDDQPAVDQPAVDPVQERVVQAGAHRARIQSRGGINLVTPGTWAVVTHRGRVIGDTPGMFELPSGPQRITLQYEDGTTQTIRVNIRADQTIRVVVR